MKMAKNDNVDEITLTPADSFGVYEKFEATIEGITLNDDGTITVFGQRPLTKEGQEARRRYEERIKKSLTPEKFMRIYNDDSGEEEI